MRLLEINKPAIQKFILRDERSWRAFSTGTALTLCALLASGNSLAQDQSDGEGFNPNGIEVFVGSTFDDGDAEASFGLNYERRLRENFGVGIMAEFTQGREWVVAVPFSWHITESWKAELAVGLELSPEGDDEFLTRIGASYEFGFSGWSLAPELNLDFSGGEVKAVVGVSIGWEFR